MIIIGIAKLIGRTGIMISMVTIALKNQK